MGNFSGYLKDIREERGFSLRDLAAKAQISPSLLSRVENGQRGVPKVDTLYSLASALNVSPDEILLLAGHKVSSDRLIYLSPSKSALNNMTEEELSVLRKSLESETPLGNITKPELRRWYLDLQNMDESELEKLKYLWEIIKSSK